MLLFYQIEKAQFPALDQVGTSGFRKMLSLENPLGEDYTSYIIK